MGNRLQCSIEEINKMSLEEIAGIGNPHTQEAVLKRLFPSRKDELVVQCLKVITEAQERVCAVGQTASSPRSFMGAAFVDPYTQLKKYSHIYTVLAGWMTKEDLEVREKGVLGLLMGSMEVVPAWTEVAVTSEDEYVERNTSERRSKERNSVERRSNTPTEVVELIFTSIHTPEWSEALLAELTSEIEVDMDLPETLADVSKLRTNARQCYKENEARLKKLLKEESVDYDKKSSTVDKMVMHFKRTMAAKCFIEAQGGKYDGKPN